MSAVIVNAQKITVNEVDEFTGDRLISSKYETIWIGTMLHPGQLQLNWAVINGIPAMSVSYGSDEVCSVNEDCNFYIIFTDGDKIVLPCAVNNMADIITLHSYSLYAHYPLSPQDIEKLQKKIISKFRMELTSDRVEGEVKTNRAQKVREMFKLLDVDTMLK